jgi:hypothetical protein
MQSSAVSRHFLPPRYKYSPHHPVLKHKEISRSRGTAFPFKAKDIENIREIVIRLLLFPSVSLCLCPSLSFQLAD